LTSDVNENFDFWCERKFWDWSSKCCI